MDREGRPIATEAEVRLLVLPAARILWSGGLESLDEANSPGLEGEDVEPRDSRMLRGRRRQGTPAEAEPPLREGGPLSQELVFRAVLPGRDVLSSSTSCTLSSASSPRYFPRSCRGRLSAGDGVFRNFIVGACAILLVAYNVYCSRGKS